MRSLTRLTLSLIWQVATYVGIYDRNRAEKPEYWREVYTFQQANYDAVFSAPELDGLVRHPKILPLVRLTYISHCHMRRVNQSLTKIAQGWPQLWAKFRPLIGTPSQNIGPGRTIRANL